MKVAVLNIGKILTGDIDLPVAKGDTIVMADGKIASIGSAGDAADCDVAIDAGGMMAMPGLIDSHVHITFGDYTPRQKTVGFLESYVHGGVTTCISASEVHVPGRPRDPAGVKALAIAAHKSFAAYRPGGMRVHAGSVILEPGLTDADFAEMQKEGVWLAKAGFGNFATPYDYAPYVAMAHEHGIVACGVERAVGLDHQVVAGERAAVLQAQRLGEMHFLGSDDTDRFHSFRHLSTGRLDGVGEGTGEWLCARLTTSLAAFIVNRREPQGSRARNRVSKSARCEILDRQKRSSAKYSGKCAESPGGRAHWRIRRNCASACSIGARAKPLRTKRCQRPMM